ncbi:hypothetical protein BDN72DRAFT_789982 [Pluteus cervinus]|uniref:Uncharacterized protein n=1 Tax=Pluteus cervinus TaxID=181527 RepID=A0ACD3B7D1_9AGAR|nr:hypothetical protein BDN72DRAFT_789982 [Pluteus cervinus]
MHTSTSQTRSSIDLGQSRNKPVVDSNKKSALTARTQPPRLQHSPSLPNIWFPPHSGPLPPRLNGSEDPLCRPVTPPLRAVDAQPERRPSLTEITDGKLMASLPVPRAQKSGKKRPVDCEQDNALLTPPLTPSSSIRTTASHDSTASRPEKDAPSFGGSLLGCSLDPSCTRFLLLGNLSRTLDSDVLRSAIVNTLAPISLKSHGNNEVIKGFYFRLQKTHGLVILAFFDLRHASSAMVRLGDSTSEVLQSCLDTGTTTPDGDTWLTCRYISADELKDMIGQSNFIASTNGAFLLYFTPHDKDAESQDIDESGASATSSRPEAPEKREVNVEILRSLLETFGSLHIFVQVNRANEDDHHQGFQVEYHDVCTAQIARSALEGRTIYGMFLHTRNLEPAPVSTSPLVVEEDSSNTSTGKLASSINSSATQPVVNLPQIGQAGQYSHIREKHLFRPELTKSRRQNDAVVHPVVNPSSSSVHAATSSPTYFYSTPPLGADVPSQHGYQTSTTESPRKPQPHESFHSATSSAEDVAPANQVWAGLPMVPNPMNVYPFVAQPECYFFPPAPPPATSPTPAFEMPYGVLPPLAFYHQATSPHPTAPMGSMGLPPPLGYDYDIRAYPTLINTWLQDHGHAVIGQTPVVPIPAEFWPTEAQQHFQPQPPMTPVQYPVYHAAPYLPLIPGPGPDDLISPAAAVDRHGPHRASPMRPVHHTSSSGGGRGGGLMTSSTPRDTAVIHERNQLNIARIEDGQDTRTTVMIKNIPNKMTDKDLITFINNVCPRKIDFLYLRMDFQNGCNVGYAFVNFIYVQDLLKFAKAKLGERWNMFSSEKVLQMSYANYQGKEALVEKFKNSCIMDEKEAWRPKIFYSEPGPEQGLPQPFPAPTHLRRKERSSHNRGALYVPGVTGNGNGSVYLVQQQHGTRRQQMGENSGPRKNRSWM